MKPLAQALVVVLGFVCPLTLTDCTLTPEQAKSAHDANEVAKAECLQVVPAPYNGLCLVEDLVVDTIIDAETKAIEPKAPVNIYLKAGQLSGDAKAEVEKKDAHMQLLRAALAVREHRAKKGK